MYRSVLGFVVAAVLLTSVPMAGTPGQVSIPEPWLDAAPAERLNVALPGRSPWIPRPSWLSRDSCSDFSSFEDCKIFRLDAITLGIVAVPSTAAEEFDEFERVCRSSFVNSDAELESEEARTLCACIVTGAKDSGVSASRIGELTSSLKRDPDQSLTDDTLQAVTSICVRRIASRVDRKERVALRQRLKDGQRRR